MTVYYFAKVFDLPDVGQVLIKIDHNPDSGRPEVRTYVAAPEGGVCSLSTRWSNSERGWELARKYFDSCDSIAAKVLADEVLAKLATKR